MFGSLFAVANKENEAIKELGDRWWEIIRQWYPGMLGEVVCVPPVYFSSRTLKPHEPYSNYGACSVKPIPHSDHKNNEAQQRTLWTLSTFLKGRSATAFILSNMDFQNYLKKPYKKVSEYQKPEEAGEVDVLIIDKRNGVFVFELKASGLDDPVRHLSEDDKIEELGKKIEKLSEQLGKEKRVVQKLLSIFPDSDIKVRAGVIIPNTSRDIFQKALQKYDKEAEKLGAVVGVNTVGEISACTFCSDDQPPHGTKGGDNLTRELRMKLENVWDSLLKTEGPGKPMSNDLYEHVVALFCGPMTTVKIPSENLTIRAGYKQKPRKKKEKDKVSSPEEARTKAGAARVIAQRFSKLVLKQEQIEILERHDDFVHLEGAPGTGKTLVLLLKILEWLKDGVQVWLISFLAHSRSVTHVIHQQATRMLHEFNPEQENRCLALLDLEIVNYDPDAPRERKFFSDVLEKFQKQSIAQNSSPTDNKVALVLDESGICGIGLDMFFEEAKTAYHEGRFPKGLSIWSASVEKCGRPCYVTDPEPIGYLFKLKMPLRCPPTIQRFLMLAQRHFSPHDMCLFEKKYFMAHPAVEKDAVDVLPTRSHKEGPTGPHHQYPAEGFPVVLIGHGSHTNPQGQIWSCTECGESVARYLKDTLKIGSSLGEHTTDRPLHHKDVMIVATHDSFSVSLPHTAFILALKNAEFNVAMNTNRGDGCTALTEDDIILIVDRDSVHGLERAVVIIIPEVPHPSDLLPDDLQEAVPQERQAEVAARELEAAAVGDGRDEASTEGEREIKAALDSLSVQAVKDVFFIGSRAVCQVILVHLGQHQRFL